MTHVPRVRWSGVKSEMGMMWSRWWPGRRRPTVGIKVMKERGWSRSAVVAGRWTVGSLPLIGSPGGVPSTYTLGPDLWDEWDSRRGGPPCGWWSGNRGRWGHQPSLQGDGRTGASSNGRNGAGRGLCGMTTIDRPGPWPTPALLLAPDVLHVRTGVYGRGLKFSYT